MTSKSATKSGTKTRAPTGRFTASRSSNDREPELDADDDDAEDDEPAPLAKPALQIRSEGQRMLLDLPGSLSTIGKPIGATKQSIAQWRTGLYTPDDRYRRAMASHYGIPFNSWGLDEPEPAEPDDDEDDDSEPYSAVRDFERLLKLLRQQLANRGLTPREKAQISDTYARTLAQKTRLERDREMVEDRTIREHPKWQRLKQTIIDALLPHPEAARAVEIAIQRLLGEDEDESQLS